MEREDEQEIIGQREVVSRQPKRIKIKIKERVSTRKKHRHSLASKIVFVIVASYLGFVFGGRIVERYSKFWQQSNVEYINPKG
jgi:hypothetical protein